MVDDITGRQPNLLGGSRSLLATPLLALASVIFVLVNTLLSNESSIGYTQLARYICIQVFLWHSGVWLCFSCCVCLAARLIRPLLDWLIRNDQPKFGSVRFSQVSLCCRHYWQGFYRHGTPFGWQPKLLAHIALICVRYIVIGIIRIGAITFGASQNLQWSFKPTTLNKTQPISLDRALPILARFLFA